jgi:hypothetical protein
MIVSSILRKQLLKTPAIATRQTPQMQESPVLLDFRANKKPPADKIPFINRWYLIWWRRGESNPCPKENPQELLRAQFVF